MKITNEARGIPPALISDLGGDSGTPEGTTPPPDCCAIDPEAIDRAHDTGNVQVFVETVVGDLTLVQSKTASSTNITGAVTATFDSAPTAGHLMVAMYSIRSNASVSPTAPAGWTKVGEVHTTTSNHGRTAMWYRIAEAGESSSVTITGSANYKNLTIAEFDGGASHVDTDTKDAQSAANSMPFGSVDLGSDVGLLVGYLQQTTEPAEGTLNAQTFTELYQDWMDGSFPPQDLSAYRNPGAAGSYGWTPTSSQTKGWCGILAAFELPDEEGDWAPGGDAIIDDDDATYYEATVANIARVDLGDAFPITGVRLLVGPATSGSKTYTITADDDPAFPSPTTIATLTGTAAGSYATLDLSAVFAPASYAYWQLTGPDETARFFSWELLTNAIPTDLTLDDLLDVDTTGVSDGEALVYDSGTGTWVPGSGGVSDHGALTGLTDDDHPQYVPITTGAVRFLDHSTVGAAETIDLDDAQVHRLTLDADCTLTLTGAVATRGGSPASCSVVIELLQDGTGGWTVTWPGTVDFGSADDQPDPTADVMSVFSLITDDGGTSWFAFPVGGSGGGTPATTVEDETTFGITPAVGTDTEYARQDHTHGSPANPVTAAAVRAVGRWEPVTDGVDTFVWDGDEIVVQFVETP